MARWYLLIMMNTPRSQNNVSLYCNKLDCCSVYVSYFKVKLHSMHLRLSKHMWNYFDYTLVLGVESFFHNTNVYIKFDNYIWSYLINHCFRNAAPDLKWLDDTWKMAKDFNKAFKMKSWVIHYEVSIKFHSFNS